MVGLACLFLTIIYIGAIFLRKKFISVLTSAVGAGGEQGHQSALLAYLTRRLAWQVLFDIGLDALPIIGSLLGRRRGGLASGGGRGLSAADELKLWWKSKRSGASEPIYDRSAESHPPIEGPSTEKPDTGNLPPFSPPEAPEIRARFDREAGREDRPVFVYADRGSAVPEEGVPPEPYAGVPCEDYRAGSGPGATAADRNSESVSGSNRFGGERSKQKPSEILVAQQETAKKEGIQAFKPQASAAQHAQKVGKTGDFGGGSSGGRVGDAPQMRPKEAYPAERTISGPGGVRPKRIPVGEEKNISFKEAVNVSPSRLRESQSVQMTFAEKDETADRTTESEVPAGRDNG